MNIARPRGLRSNLPFPTGISCLVLLAVLVPGRLHAQKTDVLTLSNGDRVTGEIKTLDYGLLKFKIQAMGTVSVRWPNVVTVQTDKRLVIVLDEGGILFGSMAPGTADTIIVQTDSGSVSVPTQSVASLERLKSNFWDALDGKAGIGLDFTQQNAKTDLNLQAKVKYVRQSNLTQLDFDYTYGRQDDVDDIVRLEASLANFRQFADRWFFLGFLSTSRNSQMSLEFRGTVGGGLGRFLVQKNRMNLSAWIAPGVSYEEFTDEPGDTSFPLALATDFRIFIWDPLKTELTNRLVVSPILDDWGRWRVNFYLDATKEIWSDFYLALGINEVYDSRPPRDTNKNDFSLTTSIGYSF